MRKITAAFFMSLVAVVELPKQRNLPYLNEKVGATIGTAVAESDPSLMGRVNFDAWAAY